MGKGNKFWLDDPEWELLRRRAETRPVTKELKDQIRKAQSPASTPKRDVPRITTGKNETQKEVVVNLKLAIPKVRLPNLKQFYVRHKTLVWRGAAALVVVGVLFLGFQVISGKNQAGEVAGTSNNPSEAAEQQAEASFNPVVPLENLKDDSGKQVVPEFRYDKERQVLSFASQYNESRLVVSQQKLPEDIKADEGKLAMVAMSFGASTPLETQKGSAYIGTDEKTKVQTAIFATDEVLVFIRSQKSLDEDEWKFYINQLTPKN